MHEVWYPKHRRQHIAGVMRSQIKREMRIKKSVLKELGSSCSVCGYDKDIRALKIYNPQWPGTNITFLVGKLGVKRFKHEAIENGMVICCNCLEIKRSGNKPF